MLFILNIVYRIIVLDSIDIIECIIIELIVM